MAYPSDKNTTCVVDVEARVTVNDHGDKEVERVPFTTEKTTIYIGIVHDIRVRSGSWFSSVNDIVGDNGFPPDEMISFASTSSSSKYDVH
ncbi:unnamed protein product [Echinostoma caproni]|uniref:Transposase_23 domain-containing protein n=1 Tax=Echinostoma caproni TaxID=27848 RepID=A0A183AJW2_9TREM|nr:unnamed protein product [Echinostoma caproni]